MRRVVWVAVWISLLAGCDDAGGLEDFEDESTLDSLGSRNIQPSYTREYRPPLWRGGFHYEGTSTVSAIDEAGMDVVSEIIVVQPEGELTIDVDELGSWPTSLKFRIYQRPRGTEGWVGASLNQTITFDDGECINPRPVSFALSMAGRRACIRYEGDEGRTCYADVRGVKFDPDIEYGFYVYPTWSLWTDLVGSYEYALDAKGSFDPIYCFQ